MTTIAENRRQIDLIAWFLVVALGFAAIRGGSGAPLVAGILAVAAIGILAAWAAWRLKPSSMLAISPDEIFFGRLDQAGTVITRGPAGRLAFRRGVKNAGWFLVAPDQEDAPVISMIGFDLAAVRQACEAHGWTFG